MHAMYLSRVRKVIAIGSSFILLVRAIRGSNRCRSRRHSRNGTRGFKHHPGQGKSWSRKYSLYNLNNPNPNSGTPSFGASHLRLHPIQRPQRKISVRNCRAISGRMERSSSMHRPDLYSASQKELVSRL